MIVVKFHKGANIVVAICDKNLIGKTISDGLLEIAVSEYFYNGEEKSEQEVGVIMKNYDNLNIIGKESISLAIRLGIIDKVNILIINGVPHVQTFTV